MTPTLSMLWYMVWALGVVTLGAAATVIWLSVRTQPVSAGGTGATTAEQARINLGAASLLSGAAAASVAKHTETFRGSVSMSMEGTILNGFVILHSMNSPSDGTGLLTPDGVDPSMTVGNMHRTLLYVPVDSTLSVVEVTAQPHFGGEALTVTLYEGTGLEDLTATELSVVLPGSTTEVRHVNSGALSINVAAGTYLGVHLSLDDNSQQVDIAYSFRLQAAV